MELKEKIINQIITFLTPLRNLYNDEIEKIISDLLNDNLTSLDDFINKYYQDTSYSLEIQDLVTSLVKENKISPSYLNLVDKKNSTNEITFANSSFDNNHLINSKPLNIKLPVLESIKNINQDVTQNDIPNEFEKNNLSSSKLETEDLVEIKITEDAMSQKQAPTSLEINITDEFNETTDNNDLEILSLEETDIEKLRKTILNAQLNYLNNANSFIQELEEMEDFEIYENLLNLNDIRYIQHSISNLSVKTLNKLLLYLESLEEEKHNLINTFTLEVIKRNLHLKKNESN